MELRTFRISRHQYRNGLDADQELVFRGTDFKVEEFKDDVCVRILLGERTVGFVRNFNTILDASSLEEERIL